MYTAGSGIPVGVRMMVVAAEGAPNLVTVIRKGEEATRVEGGQRRIRGLRGGQAARHASPAASDKLRVGIGIRIRAGTAAGDEVKIVPQGARMFVELGGARREVFKAQDARLLVWRPGLNDHECPPRVPDATEFRSGVGLVVGAGVGVANTAGIEG